MVLGWIEGSPRQPHRAHPLGWTCLVSPKISDLWNILGMFSLDQKLLARTMFKPAGMQLNVMAAACIQAMVHDWIMHYEDDKKPSVALNKGTSYGCPMSTFKFSPTPTIDRSTDDSYDNSRVAWWNANFLYGWWVTRQFLNTLTSPEHSKMQTLYS